MLIALPRGATPIDFAYAVHTDVGDTTVGAKVNGRVMPLMTELKNGDEVEIIRSKAQVPPAAWESIVVTGKARAAIRRATKNAIRKQYSGLGLRILERAFERNGKTFAKENLKPVLHRLARKDVEDVLTSVGRGELSSNDVLKAVFPDYKDERVTAAPKQEREEGWSRIRNAAGMLFHIPGRSRRDKTQRMEDSAVPIRGVRGDLPVRFAPEGAVPGDRIVGIMQPGSGITIYPIQSPLLAEFEDKPERFEEGGGDRDAQAAEPAETEAGQSGDVSAPHETGVAPEGAEDVTTADTGTGQSEPPPADFDPADHPSNPDLVSDADASEPPD